MDSNRYKAQVKQDQAQGDPGKQVPVRKAAPGSTGQVSEVQPGINEQQNTPCQIGPYLHFVQKGLEKGVCQADNRKEPYACDSAFACPGVPGRPVKNIQEISAKKQHVDIVNQPVVVAIGVILEETDFIEFIGDKSPELRNQGIHKKDGQESEHGIKVPWKPPNGKRHNNPVQGEEGIFGDQ